MNWAEYNSQSANYPYFYLRVEDSIKKVMALEGPKNGQKGGPLVYITKK
jgi:hypothetical protein